MNTKTRSNAALARWNTGSVIEIEPDEDSDAKKDYFL